MTANETKLLFDWLAASYPRNYKSLDQAAAKTVLDNLAYTFRGYNFADVLAEYRHRFTSQKTEPHPSDVRGALKGETKRTAAQGVSDAYEALRKHPKYAEMEMAYGERTVRRAAKLCVEKASIDELKFRLERDTDCREGDFYNKGASR